jgi:Mce-associated membrane protein
VTTDEESNEPATPAPAPRAVFAATPSTILAGTPTQATPAKAPVDEPRQPRQPRTGSGLPGGTNAVVAVVALAVAVAVVLTVVVTHLSGRTDQSPSGGATSAVESAASAGAKAALSYNYQHLSADFTAAEKLMTPSFKADYTSQTTRNVKGPAVKFHAVSVATIEGAGVASMSSSRATVLVFVDQTVRNSQLSAPRLDRSRVQVSLVRTDGKWLINNLSPI